LECAVAGGDKNLAKRLREKSKKLQNEPKGHLESTPIFADRFIWRF
jgi:hypothetical protein